MAKNGVISSRAMLLAAGSLSFALVLSACAGVPDARVSKASSVSPAAQQKSIAQAEAAVAANPRDPALRANLAEAYLEAGRFLAARQSFDDAYQLGDRSSRTVVNLAMMYVAAGREPMARTVLTENRDAIPAVDYGLAAALAGETRDGVDVLVAQIRGGANTAKVRQNLALAYALDGRWREAQIMASQDLDPAAVRARIERWAREAHPRAHTARVASLFGVTPQADSGQPRHLALAQEPSVLADVRLGGEPAKTEPAATDIANAGEAATASFAFPKSRAALASATVPAATPTPVKPAAPVEASPTVARPVQPARPIEIASTEPSVAAAVFKAAVTAPAGQSGFAVQLGAFSSKANADRAWKLYSGRHDQLRAHSRWDEPVTLASGRTLHRLTAQGFSGLTEARAMCASVRQAGGECLVISNRARSNGGAPRLAARR